MGPRGLTSRITPEVLPGPGAEGRIVAHRGASRVAPENTLAAITRAARQGARWVEFDASLLGDGTAVVHHDADLGRTARIAGAGPVPLAELDAGDLARIDAGAWFGAAFAGEPLPTLGAVLELCEALGLYANLEIKPHGAPRRAAEAVARSLRMRPRYARRVLVSSFDHDALAVLRAAMPDQPIAVLMKRPAPDWPAVVAALGAAALHIDFRALTGTLAAETARRGVALRVYTLNDPSVAEPFWDLGLAGVITDHPPLFLQGAGGPAFVRP